MSDILRLEDFDSEFVSSVEEVVFRKDSVHQVVASILSNARVSSVKQKSRSQVRGGGKKPWRQKGTGRARAGTRSSPLWRSGGVVFGSGNSNKNYSVKINKKFYKMAFKSIFSEMIRKGMVGVVSNFPFVEKISTKSAKLWLDENNLRGKVLLIKESGVEDLSLRNLKFVDILEAKEINPYILSIYDNVVFDEKSFSLIKERLL